MEQGSSEWFAARLGKVTASRFADVMTNGRGTGTMGQTAMSYMRELIAEELTGKPAGELSSKSLEWGTQTEPEARAMYCLHRHVRVVKEGFVQHPTRPRVGGSPDGLVEGDKDGPGGVEIKCPFNTSTHLSYIEWGQLPDQYAWQVHGLMWVTGRNWWDFVSYDPRLRDAGLNLFCVRVYKDDEMADDLQRRVTQFVEQLEIKLEKIKSKARKPE